MYSLLCLVWCNRYFPLVLPWKLSCLSWENTLNLGQGGVVPLSEWEHTSWGVRICDYLVSASLEKGISSHIPNISLFPRWTHPPILKWHIFRQKPCGIIQSGKGLIYHYTCCGKAWINQRRAAMLWEKSLAQCRALCIESGRKRQWCAASLLLPALTCGQTRLCRVLVRFTEALERPQLLEVSGYWVNFLNLAGWTKKFNVGKNLN